MLRIWSKRIKFYLKIVFKEAIPGEIILIRRFLHICLMSSLLCLAINLLDGIELLRYWVTIIPLVWVRGREAVPSLLPALLVYWFIIIFVLLLGYSHRLVVSWKGTILHVFGVILLPVADGKGNLFHVCCCVGWGAHGLWDGVYARKKMFVPAKYSVLWKFVSFQPCMYLLYPNCSKTR